MAKNNSLFEDIGNIDFFPKIKSKSIIGNIMFPNLGYAHRKISKKNMDWAQVSAKYPKMNPLGDADGDGIPNWVDCAPLNPRKQGWFHKDKNKLVFKKRVPNQEEYAKEITSTNNKEYRKQLFLQRERERLEAIKKKAQSYYSPEEAKYRELKEKKDIAYSKRRIAELKSSEDYQKYLKSAPGRIGSGINKLVSPMESAYRSQKAFKYAPKLNPKRKYNQGGFPSVAPIQRKTLPGTTSGRRGRPRGTYNPLYAKYGGVYGYRKVLAQQLRERRMALQRNMTLSPAQQETLRQMQERQNASQENPENRAIPDTAGTVRLAGLHQEAEDAANAFA